MARRQRRDADDMHVVLHRLARGFVGGLEQRTDINVEAEIGEGGCDDLLPAVVSVLAHLGDEDARPSSVLVLERVDQRLDAVQASIHAAHLRLVDAGHRRNLGTVAAIDLLERVGDLADGRLCPGGANGAFEKVAPACLGAFGERVKSRLHFRFVTLGFEPLQLVQLLAADGAVVDFEDGDVGVAVLPVFVHADDGLAAESMRPCVAVAACSIMRFGMPASIALAMPPNFSTSSMCLSARAARSCVSRST